MALEYKSQHVSDEKKTRLLFLENITVRRFIMSGNNLDTNLEQKIIQTESGKKKKFRFA